MVCWCNPAFGWVLRIAHLFDFRENIFSWGTISENHGFLSWVYVTGTCWSSAVRSTLYIQHLTSWTAYWPFLIFTYYIRVGTWKTHTCNTGVSHYRILPISRDIGWPIQHLDYFRYKATYTDYWSHFIELLYIGYNSIGLMNLQKPFL